MANYSCPNANPQAWRSCVGGSRFVGCCKQDPCEIGCALESLLGASFNPDVTDEVPRLECDDASAAFYTCTNTSPPFLGCCKSNACSTDNGCPSDQLSPAILGNDTRATAFFSPTGVPSSPTASSTSTPVSSNGSQIGAAVGGAVGFALVLIVLVYFVWWKRRRRQREIREAPGPITPGFPQSPTHMTSYERAELSKMSSSPPPRYSAVHDRDPVFELEGQQGYTPVELEGSSPMATRNADPKSSKRRGLRFFRTRQPTSLNISHDVQPQVSPQLHTFLGTGGGNVQASQASSLSPWSPHSPWSEMGRPSPTHPPTIVEDEVPYHARGG